MQLLLKGNDLFFQGFDTLCHLRLEFVNLLECVTFLFLLVIIVNSLLQSASFIPQDGLAAVTQGINSFDTFLLTMAMTALGAETTFDKFKQAGLKPFLLAAILFLWLTVGGYFITKLIV